MDLLVRAQGACCAHVDRTLACGMLLQLYTNIDGRPGARSINLALVLKHRVDKVRTHDQVRDEKKTTARFCYVVWHFGASVGDISGCVCVPESGSALRACAKRNGLFTCEHHK